MDGHGKFAALEGWRGACALFVVLLHFSNNATWHLGHASFVTHSYLFVDFFFVLSGFVITHAYGQRIGRVADIVPFAIRRFGRLWPLHATVLLAYAVIELAQYAAGDWGSSFSAHPPFTDTRTPAGFIANLALVQGLAEWRGAIWNGPSWTISVELWTYLTFALVCLAPLRGRRAITAALCIVGLIALDQRGLNMTPQAGYGFFRSIYGFFLGSLVYRVRPSAISLPAIAATFLEVAVVIVVALFVSIGGDGSISMCAPVLFAAAVYLFSFERGAVSRALIARPMALLGTWSYSVYLTHYIVIVVAMTGLRHFAGLPIVDAAGILIPVLIGNKWIMDGIAFCTVSVVLFGSFLSYRLVETPSRRYFNALARRYWLLYSRTSTMPPPPAAPATATCDVPLEQPAAPLP